MKEIKGYQAKQQGTIMLNANERYKNVSPSIMMEIQEEIGGLAMHRYPDETSRELIEAYADVCKIAADQILAGNGSDEMLGFLIGYFLGKDTRLYTLSPDFSMYDYYAAMHEVTMVKFTCEQDGSFDVDAFIEYGREQEIDMILFSNPNNPSGHALCNEEISRIVEAFPCIPVVIDEAYIEFANESMITMLDAFPNLYITRTLSKAYGLAGARLGFLLGNRENIARLRPNIVPYNISCVTQKIGTIVLRHANEYRSVIEETKQERDALYQEVSTCTKMTFYPSWANYLYGRSPYKEAMLERLQENGIVIRTYPDDSFRITIGSKEENARIKEILRAFDKEAAYANS